MKKHREFTLEFKQEAVKLVTEQGYTQAETGKSLGISSKNISRWMGELKQKSLLGPSKKPSAEQEELQRLRKENKRLLLEREILKRVCSLNCVTTLV